VVAWDLGLFAFADAGVVGLVAAVEDCAWCPVGGAVRGKSEFKSVIGWISEVLEW